MKFKHILVPTDFSEPSEKAIKAAGLLADYFGCTVDLIHVIPVMKYFTESMEPLGLPFSLEKHIYPHTMEIAQEKLERLAEKHIKKEHRGRMIEVIERKPSTAICERANKGDYDLILMSSKGEHNSIHLMGGTTEKVIRYSHIPVFTINDEMSLDNIRNIVVPLDFSEHSYFSLIPAFELAKEIGAKITVLNVVELYSAGSDMIPYVPTSIDADPLYESMIAKLQEYFLEFEDYDLGIQRTGVVFEDKLIHFNDGNTFTVEMETKILKGITAYQEIVDYANEEADLVVMSTHGRTGLSRVFIGSTTEQVSRHIEKPLFTVRPQFYEVEA